MADEDNSNQDEEIDYTQFFSQVSCTIFRIFIIIIIIFIIFIYIKNKFCLANPRPGNLWPGW
jgi:hypothetical protein